MNSPAFSLQLLPPNAIVLGENVRRTVVRGEMDYLCKSIHELRQLGEGIGATGIVQALMVRPLAETDNEHSHQLIFGQKRLLAAQQLRLPAVPCLVDFRAEDEMAPFGEGTPQSLIRLLQLTENGQRSDPPPLDEAAAIRSLMDDTGLSLRVVARTIGKSKGYVENRLRLLKAEPDVQRMVSLRKDTLPHAYYINQVQDPAQRAELIQASLEDDASVRDVQRRIEEAKTNSDSSSNETPEVSALSFALAKIPPGHRPDLISSNLRPAVSLLAEAARLLPELAVDNSQKKFFLCELELLRHHISSIEAIMQ